MFNRVKITSLLVVAATVISTIPANAATSIQTRDGRFDNAIAYTGKYLYDGYKGNESSSIYISNDSTDNKVDNSDDYSDYIDKYGEKYVIASESDREHYLVDLSTGRIDTSETIEEKQENAAQSLRNKLKNTDRYGDDVSVPEDNLERIEQKQFGDVWYKYTIQPGDAADSHEKVTSDGCFIGFVNSSGYYVDASDKANLTVISGGKTVKIDEFGKAKNNVTATLKSMDVITQDIHNIYVLTTVNVSGGETSSSEEVQTFVQKISKSSNGDKDGASIPNSVDSYMLSSILDSEAAGYITLLSLSSPDSVYCVRNGELYLVKKISNNDIKVIKFTMKRDKISLSGDSRKMDIYLIKVDDYKTHDISKDSSVSIDVNGNIWGIDDGKIFKFDGLTSTDVYTCDASLDKIDVYDENNLVAWKTSNDIYSSVMTASSMSLNNSAYSYSNSNNSSYSSDYNYNIDNSSYNNENSNSNNNNYNSSSGYNSSYGNGYNSGSNNSYSSSYNNTTNNSSYGNNYRNNSGSNSSYNNNYNNNMNSSSYGNGYSNNSGSVNNSNNSNTNSSGSNYNNGSNSYNGMNNNNYNVNGNSNNQSGNNNVSMNGVSNLQPSGWLKQNGNWYYYNSDGSRKNGWYYELGNWYYFYDNGQMATSFLDLNDAVYYLNPGENGNQGAMKTGWQEINDKWYYFNPVSDSFGLEGMMQRGWREIEGKWYYFNYDGTMATDTKIGRYYVDATGVMVQMLNS